MGPPPAAALSGGSDDTLGDPAVFGVVTVSDRATAGTYADASGPAILQFFAEAVRSRSGLRVQNRSFVQLRECAGSARLLSAACGAGGGQFTG